MPVFADTSETQLARIAEVTWGTTPASPAFSVLRFTGEDLTYEIENIVSDEISALADVKETVQVGRMATGGFTFEVSHNTLDDIFAAVLRGAWSSDVLKTGVVKSSDTLEKKYETGSTDHYLRFTGCRYNTLNLSINEKRHIVGGVTILGEGAALTTSAVASSTYSTPNTNSVFSAADVASITIGGVSGTAYLRSININLTNNLRVQNAIGSDDAIGIAYGRREISGSLEAYFDAAAASLLEDFIAGASATLSFQMGDGTNTLDLELPKIKWQRGRVVTPGNNQDVIASLDFQALYDASETCAMKLTRSS